MKRPIHRTPVTQKQIAAELGVSRQLVSLALNGTGRISATNRTRVQETARRLGYDATSNLEARAMIARRYSKRARTGLLGCVAVPSVEDPSVPNATRLPYEIHLLQGVRRTAHQHGRDVVLLPPVPSSGWERVDGLLVHGPNALTVRERLGVEIPIVTMMHVVPGLDGVKSEDREGASLATEHLIQLGHRRIGYLHYAESTPAVQERLLGYEAALRRRGIRPQKSWLGELANHGPMIRRGQLSMEAWLRDGWEQAGCTALLVQNDRAAVGAMAALRAAGIRVPQDLSVIGYDSTDECELTVPRLTSVEVPLEEIGARAARILLDLIENDVDGSDVAVSQVISLPTRLEMRDSTCPPSAS